MSRRAQLVLNSRCIGRGFAGIARALFATAHQPTPPPGPFLLALAFALYLLAFR